MNNMAYCRNKSILAQDNSLKAGDFDADVLIAGAGPSGAICAYYLAQAGKKVILIDSHSFPRDKVCGDFVSPVSLKELMTLGITDLPEFKATNMITEATVYVDGQKLITDNIPQIKDFVNYGRVIPRVLLDTWIVNAAKQQGVNVITDCKLVNYFVNEQDVSVECEQHGKKRRFLIKMLVGADGSNSTVARILQGKKPNPKHKIVAVRAYCENINCIPHQATLFFTRNTFPGYFWFFPTSSTTANVGIGMVLKTFPKNETNLKAMLLEMIENDPFFKTKISQGMQITKIAGWPLSCYDPSTINVKDRVLLTGDAAGFINPFTGEGIQYALQSGRLAAETIIGSFETENFSAGSLKRFDTKVSEGITHDLSFVNILMQLTRNRNLNVLWLNILKIILYQAKKNPKHASLSGGFFVGIVPMYRLLSISYTSKTILDSISCFFKTKNIFKQTIIFIRQQIVQVFNQKMTHLSWITYLGKSVLLFMRLSIKVGFIKIRIFLKRLCSRA
ncbi:NAD(P)/FAD-dependent oxidoreductase [Legionella longbeachae]|uniref:NAD(P)/FAD-dependent oxidoreductase n=1 Tax=Legionella longbeachae TaxID=450 RepID=UPI0012442374|nr:NAD(P)/FAD-dependent oxidoreductase [Legionella longbeachae]QEY50107.1 NAD(P)/FAD-dependent oxidoreductase [Legionella longbeachae]QEY50237.1 NAD(P)/FAD-dependent oxidoreductase [Legionella longbeachae]